nr:hypothetical protein [candidate division KSB1 bacterium]
MATRTNAVDVKNIIDTDLSDVIVEEFVGDANLIVTDIVGSDTNLSDAQKESIEKWLTAHLLAATRDQQPQAEGAGDARITYQGKTSGLGLEGTMYGQQVLLIDTTG